MKRLSVLFAAPLLALGVAGCHTSHEIKTESEIKPVHITIDVNLKVDRELDAYFDELDRQAQ